MAERKVWIRHLFGEGQRRITFLKFLIKIIIPLDIFLLKIRYLREFQTSFHVGDFQIYFRPFIYSDLVMLFSDWEPYVKKVFKPKKGETVFDVGAHIGIYTLMSAQRVGKEGVVVAFEPDDENFSLLQKNIEANALKMVKIFKLALGKNNDDRTFYMDVDPILSSLSPSPTIRNKITIRVATLDSVLKQLRIHHIDWIKIDVEGNEMDVLEGGQNAFNDFVEKVIIETSQPKVTQFLSQRNFKIKNLITQLGSYFLCEKEHFSNRSQSDSSTYF